MAPPAGGGRSDEARGRDRLALAVAKAEQAFEVIRAAIEDDPKTPKRVLTVRGAGYIFAKRQDTDSDA